MISFKQLYKWFGPISVLIALGITSVFYFKRVFTDDVVLVRLGIIQHLAAVVALLFGLIFVRRWHGIVTLILLGFVIAGIIFIDVGIH